MNLAVLDRMACSQFTSLEKQSIYQAVCGAMACDGDRDPREIRVIEEIVDIIGLTQSERVASRQLDEQTMSACIRKMSDLQRIYVGKFIAQIILADGKVTPSEQIFFDYITQKFNLPNMD